MVDVITPAPQWLVDCPRCSARLAYSRTDIRSTGDGRFNPGISVITCPECRSDVPVDTKKDVMRVDRS